MNTTLPPEGDHSLDPGDPADDPRVLRAAREYLADLEAGRRPDRRRYEARHPDLARVIAECLDGVELAHAIGSGVTATEAPGEFRAEPPGEFRGEPLGDFRIVRELGRGGMGVVYEAVQLSLGRRVALKVLPFAAGLDAKQLQRFRTESHAAAQLHHTNIVPVYAVGCERGTHYYAMQIIDGKPLNVYIDELRAADPGTSTLRGAATRLATAARREAYRTAARVALQVAEALDHAHEAGVIHRDVKPANLLLDARGNVWVTDFGLAQMTAEAGVVTRTGDVFGTLRYMSPEQAAGRRADVDHRTDVYSLGASLYELLTRQPIFPGADRQTLLNQVLHEEPARPSAHDGAIPPDLETIVLKATAKHPAERYGAAGELAADLRRYLDDRPILARRPTAWERGRKWLRRHPAYARAALLTLALGAVGLAGTTAAVLREQARTEVAYRDASQRAAEAEERFQLARRSADEMIRIADEELADDPAQQALRRKLLEAALAYYQELVELRKDDSTAQAELEVTRSRVETILGDLAVMQGAWQHLLLKRPSVQDDLGLTPAQREQVRAMLKDITRDAGPPGRGDGTSKGPLHRLKPDERGARILEDVRRHEASITALLTPSQLKRLRQVALQVRGPMAFQEPEVVAALKLTPEQRERLRPPMPEWREGGPPFAGRPPRDYGRDYGPGRPPGFDRGPPNPQWLAVLTPEQRQRWTELTGEPFAGEPETRPYRP